MTSDGKITHSISVGTSFGVLCLIASERGLTGARFIPDVGFCSGPNSTYFDSGIAVGAELFRRKPLPLTINFDEHGTSFQREVWSALRTIPYGQCVSYLDIAKKIVAQHRCVQ